MLLCYVDCDAPQSVCERVVQPLRRCARRERDVRVRRLRRRDERERGFLCVASVSTRSASSLDTVLPTICAV